MNLLMVMLREDMGMCISIDMGMSMVPVLGMTFLRFSRDE